VPRRRRTGLVVGLVLGGLALVVLVLVGAALLTANSDMASDGPDPTSTSPTATTEPVAIGGATTVPGAGPRSSMTATAAAATMRREQERTTPDLAVGAATCPAGPYRVGHRMVCLLDLEGTEVSYVVEITSDTTINLTAVRTIIDTRKAAALIEGSEPGTTADCGPPRIRQVEVDATFECTTATSTWDFTVQDADGQLSGVRR